MYRGAQLDIPKGYGEHFADYSTELPIEFCFRDAKIAEIQKGLREIPRQVRVREMLKAIG